MTPEERMNMWNNLDLQTEFGNALIATATDAEQMIKSRVQETGMNAEGIAYRDYTARYKRFKQGAVKHRVKTNPENKNNSNKYKGYTDFSFTNRMWISVGIISSQEEANNGKVVITAKGTNRDILKYNVDRFGEILDVSDNEYLILKNAYSERVNASFKQAGL